MDLVGSLLGNTGSVNSLTNNLFNAVNALLTATSVIVPQWPPNAVVNDGDTFDFVIAGAGSAGSVLAARLSENPNYKVLLIEVGGDPPIASVVPGGLPLLIKSPTYDWNYYTTNDGVTAQAQSRKGEIFQPRGKMLGGTSSLNYMYYVRGNPNDYNGWAKAGFNGWDWESVFPYFLKAEGMQEKFVLENPNLARYHNNSGPVKVSQPTYSNLIEEKLDVFINAFDELGIKKFSDYNGESQYGITRSFYTHSESPSAKRSSTAQAYLVPARDRSNLFVLKNAFAKKILIENKKAVGVEILVNKKTIKVYANKEVIASCGVINTPKLLLASGIGRKRDLEKLNIETVTELPVGDYLIDHPVVPFFITGKSDLATVISTAIPGSYNLDANPLPNLTGFFNLNGDSDRPDYQVLPIYFTAASPILAIGCSLVFNYETDVCLRLFVENLNTEIFFTYLTLLHQKSRGRLEFTSVEPDVAPLIYNDFLSDPADMESFKEGLKVMVNFTSTSYFKKAKSRIWDPEFDECKGLEYMSDSYWECYIRTSINTFYHPAATCAMGKVVDENLKVYNVENLRVIDGSIFPNDITSGNPNAPTIMIAEKMSDVIKQYHAGV